MWILPVEIWGLRYRAKCLSSGYVLYYCILCMAYIFSFWIHPDGATERTLDEEALVAPSSLQRSLLEYAALLTLVGVYVFLALPETTGLMFEDSDELFSLEEYDVVGYCFPRGTGSGYLGTCKIEIAYDVFEYFLSIMLHSLQDSELLSK
jgi:hypothetical protein